MSAKLLQLCLTLRDHVDCSLPGFFVHRFSRQEYWSQLACSPPGDLPNPGIELGSLVFNLHWQVGPLPLAPPGKPFGHWL